jgi:hypothetical protein
VERYGEVLHALSRGGQRNANAAWYYPDPTPAAENIRNFVAFSNGVRIVNVPQDGDHRENPFVALCRRIMTRK